MWDLIFFYLISQANKWLSLKATVQICLKDFCQFSQEKMGSQDQLQFVNLICFPSANWSKSNLPYFFDGYYILAGFVPYVKLRKWKILDINKECHCVFYARLDTFIQEFWQIFFVYFQKSAFPHFSEISTRRKTKTTYLLTNDLCV